MTTSAIDPQTYRRRIRAWTLYDWANSAFVTTVLAALLPVYYSSVAGGTLPSEATATAYWSLSLSVALLIAALLAPILGTVSDVMRGKKRLLAIFVGVGVLATGLMVFINTGDWFLASMLLIIGRVGFSSANVFYQALLPHVAKEDDLDIVSTRGYAVGYLGGGLLLAVNVVMVQTIPDSWFENAGVRLSFLSVAVWWAVFSIPILRQVPEPPAATAILQKGQTIVGASFQRLRDTLRQVRQYRELFKYLVAFLIYNDAIGTIIGVAVIYGAELGFGTIELVLALLLVQFTGIPFSLIFGNLPSKNHPRRHQFLAFILFNVVMLPTVAIIARFTLTDDLTGNQPPPYETSGVYYGEGEYPVTDDALTFPDDWGELVVPGDDLTGSGILGQITTLFTGTPDDVTYALGGADSQIDFTFNGQNLILTHDEGPDRGKLAVLIDGQPLMDPDEDDDTPLVIDMYNATVRYNVRSDILLDDPGQYTLTLVNNGDAHADSLGQLIALAEIEVSEPVRVNNLAIIFAGLLALQVVGGVFAYLFADRFLKLADWLDTRRSILLALLVYCVVAVWGFVLDSTVEFWFLAWMVAMVQGGSQALSRSLYASLTPAAKSGEFFGLYAIMDKMAAITGPLIFAIVVALAGTSRPAVLSLVVMFVVGGFLLTRVDIAAGQQRAREEDAHLLGVSEV